jgi:hypothetical protein
MALYSTTNTNAGTQQAVSASYKTLLSLTAVANTLTGARIFDVLIGTDGTPADNAMDWDISRQTAAGTATATIPNPLDLGTRAAGTGAAANFTAEGTITAGSSVFAIGINQRASYRWVAAPGSELILPAVAAAGFALRTKSPGYTGTATATMFHSE